MKNRDLIIKTARRLDKFNLDELIAVSKLDEKEVAEILSDLAKKQIVLKNNNTYFFNTKKSAEMNDNNAENSNGFKPIVIEEETYADFLELGEEAQNRIRGYIALLNIINQTGSKNLKQVVEYFNEPSAYKKIALSAFIRIRSNFNKYGLKGYCLIIPTIIRFITSKNTI